MFLFETLFTLGIVVQQGGLLSVVKPVELGPYPQDELFFVIVDSKTRKFILKEMSNSWVVEETFAFNINKKN